MKTIRSPLVVVVGHVDHGKSSILDYIRGTSVVAGEPGAITQAIGASIIPLDKIKNICGPLLDALKINITIPGFLIVDTPGHAAFTNIRKRGGNLADIAIVVISVMEGVMPQTQEALEILKSYKTPFIVALNKIDLISGWKKTNSSLLQEINSQAPNVQQIFETKLYEIVGKLAEFGFNAERFDRVSDYTKQVALVPVSAHSGSGIPELLMVMTGLAQKYLESCLQCDTCADAKGIILEVKEEKGLGKTLDVILYDGCLKVNDTIVIGSLGEPIVSKIKALFQPKPLVEMMDPKAKFNSVREVTAATGVKVSAKDIDNAVAGMPFHGSVLTPLDKVKEQVQKEIQEVLIHTDSDGIIVKADTLGSLEAVDIMLKERNIPVRKASIGLISKKDISDAESSYDKDPFHSIILGFNVKISSDAEIFLKDSKAHVITNNIIYKLIEDFEKWQEEEKKRQESKDLDLLIRPCKVRMLGKGYIFRQNNPAVFGVDVLQGVLKSGTPLMKLDGSRLNNVKSLQHEQDSVDKAEKGKQVAVSVPGITVGRQISEIDTLISDIPESDFRKLKDFKKHLSKDEIELLKEIAEIKRKDNPVWGV